MLPQNLKIAGYLSKPHGIDGTMVLRLKNPDERFTSEKEFLFVSFDMAKVPFFLEEIQIMDTFAFIRFEGINSSEDAEFLRGKSVFYAPAEKSAEIPGSLVGYKLVNEKGEHVARVISLHEDEMNPLMEVEREGKEYLVPLHEDFILSINQEDRILMMNLPDGLFD